MIPIKNEREIDAMRQACKLTAAARALAGRMVRPGVTTRQIDKAVHDFIVSHGAKPSFLHYGGFPASACISVNETVIHGIPDHRVLREGDIVSVDVGAYYEGFLGIAPRPMLAEKFLRKPGSSLMSQNRVFLRV